MTISTTNTQSHNRSKPHVHSHNDGHADGHSHEHVSEAGQAPQGGPVMLDIGGDTGALIAFMDADLVGTEIHVRRLDETTTTHTGVWERDLGPRRVVVAVFPALREGVYDILDADGGSLRSVMIQGGSAAEIDLQVFALDAAPPA